MSGRGIKKTTTKKTADSLGYIETLAEQRSREFEIVQHNKDVLSNVLSECIEGNLRVLNFEVSYRAAYNLQIYRHGMWVLDAAAAALRRLNLKPYNDKRYAELAQVLSDVTTHPNRMLAVRYGFEHTKDVAIRLRSKRGLQLWRKLITKWADGLGRVDLWKERIVQWKMAFNAVSFRPGESGAQATEDHFFKLATLHDV